MSGIKNREKAFENKFALEEEQEFKAKAMASKLFAIWAAVEMKMAELDSKQYSKKLIELSINNKEIDPIIEFVYKDFANNSLKVSKSKLEHIFQEKLELSRAKILIN
jgi:hypothetical protein